MNVNTNLDIARARRKMHLNSEMVCYWAGLRLLSLINDLMLLGDNGNWVTCTSNDCKALTTALEIAPPVATNPPSPAPLTPRGLFGDGASSETIAVIGGTSVLVGRR